MMELRGSANEWDNSPPSEALLEFLGRRHLPGAADALRAAKAEPFSQINLVITQPELMSGGVRLETPYRIISIRGKLDMVAWVVA